MKRIFTTIATMALASTLLAGTALAHAEFASANPAPGQTLSAAPAAVTITYTEDLASGSVGSVTNGRGVTVSTGSTVSTTQRKLLTIALQPNLPSGVYNVSWHSVSADDGDQLDGSFFFNVSIPAAAAPAAPAARAPAGPIARAPNTATQPATDARDVGLALLALAAALALVSLRSLRRRTV